MKKNDDVKKSMKSVNSQLGSFGIEPPKRYRESDDEPRRTSQRQVQKSTADVRKAQKHSRKRKRFMRKTVLIVCLVLLAAAAIIIPSLTVFFNIDTITVKGSKLYSAQQIQSVCSINKGDNLWLTDTDKAGQKLTEALPYVYSVTIERKLPGTVKITVKDGAGAYNIDNGNKTYTLLDDNFKVLETATTNKGKSMSITDVKVTSAVPGKPVKFDNSKRAECLKKLAQAVKKYKFLEATSISSKGLNSNFIVYDNRITFKLGTCDNLENKIYQGLAACKQLNETSPSAKGTLNLTGDKTIYFTDETE